MVIILWFTCSALFITAVIYLAWLLIGNPQLKEALSTIANGFRDALRGCGFQKKYPVELWKWETMHDEDVCEDCQERASWPPMDIADWMKEGMPRTPEAETKCGENCRCELTRYYPGLRPVKHQRKI